MTGVVLLMIKLALNMTGCVRTGLVLNMAVNVL